MINNRLTYLLLTIVLLFSVNDNAYSQNFPGCASIDAGTDITLGDCSDVVLTSDVFEVGSTETYEVQSIPYAPPISYTQPGGTPVSVNIDDTWSSVINLPFDFCYFGNVYTTAQIGSNGAISLGTSHCTTSGCHPWSFDNQVPFTSPANAGHILGLYHDVNPYVGGTINYYLLGEAPCRVFIVVFNELPHYSCTSLRSTFMMVLYETTNVIDVYVEKKELCTSWNGGRAAIGIQNPAGNVGYTAPGRNTGQWSVNSSSPEAWRFQPTGTALPHVVEWLEGAMVIATGSTVTVSPSVPTTYTARATYTSCNGDEIVVEDDVLVTPTDPNPMIINATEINVSCHGLSDGSITANVTGGEAPYTYSIDGLTFTSNNVFTDLESGTYSIAVEDAEGCLKHVFVEITDPGTIGLDGSTTNLSCFEYDDGSVSLTHTGGTSPFTYTVNGGPSQSDPVFSDLSAGTYQFIATDANGCQDSVVKVITQPNPPTSHISMTDSVFCAEGTVTIETTGVSNGSFSATPSGLIISSISGLINLQNSQPGTYDVVYSFTENGCAYKDTLRIRVIGSSDLGVPKYIDLCIGESWTPNAQGANNIVWSDGLVNGETVEGILGSYTYYVSGNIESCQLEDSVVVTTHPLPDVDFTANPVLGPPPLPVVFENTSNGSYSYLWTFGDGDTTTDNSLVITHTFDNVGDYNTVLTATDQYGCQNAVSQLIKVIIPDMVYTFPNIFTPNGDGQNDAFFVTNLQNVNHIDIVILNRWGNVVFESSDLNFAWNGKVNNSGAECEDGIYFYKAELSNDYGEQETAHGYVHLNRNN